MPDEQTPEPTVTDEGLSAALDDLLKAADATTLVKGATHSGKGSNSVETGPRVDEDGLSSGALAGDGERGGIDTLMVAKMTEAGIPADVIANFAAFMSIEVEEDDDEKDEDEDEDEAEKSYGSSFHKSSMDSFREDSDLADTIDVSPFLEALTARTADAIDEVRKSASQFEGQQNHVNQKLALALHQVGTLIKSQHGIIQTLGERLNLVERTPAPQKGATSLSGAQPLAKSLPGELGQGNGAPLKKSEILSTLSYMNLEKGMKEIHGQRTSELVGLFEGGNIIEPRTVEAVESFLTDTSKRGSRGSAVRLTRARKQQREKQKNDRIICFGARLPRLRGMGHKLPRRAGRAAQSTHRGQRCQRPRRSRGRRLPTSYREPSRHSSRISPTRWTRSSCSKH